MIRRKTTLSKLALALLLVSTSVHAQQLIFESATLGPTNQVANGVVVNVDQYFGVRFQIKKPTTVTAVGVHAFAENFTWASHFGAYIVRLRSANALPEGDPFTPKELVASTVIVPTDLPSREYIVPLSAELPPGHYALIFGGIGTNAGLPANGVDHKKTRYLSWYFADGWRRQPWHHSGGQSFPGYYMALYVE